MTEQGFVRGLENTVLSAYEYLKQESASALGVATMAEQPVALVETSAGRSASRRKRRGEGSSPWSCGSAQYAFGRGLFRAGGSYPLPRGQASRRPQLHEALRHGRARASERLRSLDLSAFVRE
jgi:hypothetical protein